MLKEKILSIPQHCSNNHVFIGNKEHLTCSHGPLGDRTKAWLPSDSKVIIKPPTEELRQDPEQNLFNKT